MRTIGQILARAQAEHQAGNLRAVEQLCWEVLQTDPAQPDALHRLGLVAGQTGKPELAVQYLERVAALQPRNPFCRVNLGLILSQLGRWDEAARCFEQALGIQPNQVEAHFGLGEVLAARGQGSEAIVSFQQVLRLQPGHAAAHNSLGAALAMLGKLDEAVANFREAVRLHPLWVKGHYNLGTALLDLGKPEEAAPCFQQALQLQPDLAAAHVHLGRAWLLLGDLEKWWPEFEWSWQVAGIPQRPFAQPVWDGSALPGQTILLYANHGLGDTLHFVRYAAIVKQRVGTVIVECQESLVLLLTSCPGVDRVVARGSVLPAFHVQAALPAVPRIVGTTLATLPADVPYVGVEDALVEHWRRIVDAVDQFKIGIAWQGNPQYGVDNVRSVALADFGPLFDLPGVRFFSLQKGHGREQLHDLADRYAIVDLGDETSADFTDTAAVVKNLDLVISVDTAVAHLAGALGAPVWVALPFGPDWRWLLSKDDSPWYPTMRLFRQTEPGNWAGVFARMRVALEGLLGN